MRNTLIFTAIIICGVGVFYFISSSDFKSKQNPDDFSSADTVMSDLTQQHTSNASGQSGTNSADDSVLVTLWEESEKAREFLQSIPEKLPGDLAGEAYIEVNTQHIKTMQLGDTFELTVPQLGTSLSAEVDMVTEHPNGDKTIEANFPGMDKYYSVVFTVGASNSYAQVSTPDGVYLLEAHGDYAWIASRHSLVASHWSEHQDGIAIPENPVSEAELNNDDIDVEFDYVIQESSSDDNPKN